MRRNNRTRREKVNQLIRRGENLSKVLQMSKAMQTRFNLIPASALNKVTVAGIRDMSLGRVKDGKPVGMIFNLKTFLSNYFQIKTTDV